MHFLCIGFGDLTSTLQPPSSHQHHHHYQSPNNGSIADNFIFDQLDAAQLSRHHQNSTSNREFSSRKMSMSPYLSPTSKLASSLSHSPGMLGSSLPLRRQMSNKSSLSLAGGAFFINFPPA